MKKRQHLRRVGAATKIQALARGIRGRKWMKKNRRRLIRERTARLKVETVLRSQCGISSQMDLVTVCMYFPIASGAAAESVYSNTVLLSKSSRPSGGRSKKESKGSRAQRTERVGRAGAKSRRLTWRIHARTNGYSIGNWGERNGRQKVSASVQISDRLSMA